MIKANLTEIEKTTKKAINNLKVINKKSIPHATRFTLNNLAYKSQQEAQKLTEKDFINRNKFTKKSLRFEKANGINIRKMNSFVGSVADYMRLQEEGGLSKSKSVPSLGSRVSKNEKKMVSRAKYISKMGLIKGKYSKKGSKGSQYIAKLYAGLKEKKAVKIGNSLYQVNSIKRSKGRIKPKITKLYTINQRLRVKPVKILERSVKYATSRGKVDREFLHNLTYQIKKFGK